MMQRFLRRRTTVLALAVVALATIPLAATATAAHGRAATPAGAESAAGAKTEAISTPQSGAKWRDLLPLGVWEAEVETPGGTHTLSISFDRRGRACLKGGGGATGTGHWYPTGWKTFSYRIVEHFPSPDGTPQGHAEISDDATQSGGTYHAKGTSKVFDAAGNHVATFEGEANFVRVSTTDPGRICRN
ncbi:hypothetical protein ACPB9J_34160 [Streptomyces lavendulocolor]|uniref:hypothetical protein n=1 Tax=Streptomyces lavendulocolor TaxID=67316 RepID=UPI003C2AB3ED